MQTDDRYLSSGVDATSASRLSDVADEGDGATHSMIDSQEEDESGDANDDMAELSGHSVHSSRDSLCEPKNEGKPEGATQPEPAFLTEASFTSLGSQLSKTSRVTIKTPSDGTV